ncbi:MAG: hypothetical protein A2086_13205 [Spirochaetes bacterium GWD1_27_9]|nr:MAG: hypothetical protein A2086_13205 [Spirochaetes bacterium GWD1_27_9]
MDITKIKKIHIIGIGGCASSAIAEFLAKNSVSVSGSEMKYRDGLTYLENMGVKIYYSHDKANLNNSVDLVLFSPAVTALNPNNPELIEAKSKNIPLISWQTFIGEYLNNKGKKGITVCGSEGKGTTAGILTSIVKDTDFDPLAILGAKIKNIYNNTDSNIYIGRGETYILEGDEFNRNFLNYHPSINVMINFEYEHPETYKDFNEYQLAFYQYFKGMNGGKTLILRATDNIINFVDKYNLSYTHKIIWFGKENELKFAENGTHYLIKDHKVDFSGNNFVLQTDNKQFDFFIPSLPGYLALNATGAIIAAFELGLPYQTIKENIKRFTGMVRRFDLYKTKNNGIFVTDYGHSPESVNHIIKEIKTIFSDKKLHLVFQPHLFSRTYNFFNEFVESLGKADKISLIDIYPAREKEEDWLDKISSYKIYEKLSLLKKNVFYAGKSKDIATALSNKIDESEVTCFIGAGDMDLYFPALFDKFEANGYF